MRKNLPDTGDVRTKTAFLLFPKTLPLPNGTYQRRWLETATWLEEVCIGIDHNGMIFWSWVPQKWIITDQDIVPKKEIRKRPPPNIGQ